MQSLPCTGPQGQAWGDLSITFEGLWWHAGLFFIVRRKVRNVKWSSGQVFGDVLLMRGCPPLSWWEAERQAWSHPARNSKLRSTFYKHGGLSSLKAAPLTCEMWGRTRRCQVKGAPQ